MKSNEKDIYEDDSPIKRIEDKIIIENIKKKLKMNLKMKK